ncbi:hypothetical protein B0T10DRAFT_585891 [Thelonectria olida]|uniref:Uncharacterized protein n=1 Tax=Thelonectria olida TaxID=1576542 RepID=A0A9P8VSY4_9HYPO|nr:hypothetical protein B0T10DRAFT_585891 [Thelonectria olida]
MISALDKTRMEVRRQIISLTNRVNAPSSDVRQSCPQEELAFLENRFAEALSDVIVLRFQKNQILGECADVIKRMDKRAEVDDWGAHIMALVRHYQTPEAARLHLFKPVDQVQQERFRELVLDKYEAIKVDKGLDFTMAWCCIEGRWKRGCEVSVAHLVPADSGEANAIHVLGDARCEDTETHLLAPANGIPVSHYFREALESGRIVLQPVENSEDIKVIVLGKGEMDSSLKEYHGQPLKFKNNFRPSKLYMYFHFISTIIQLQRHNEKGWWRQYMTADVRRCWGVPGLGLRKSTLRVLAQHVGHMNLNEAKELLGLGKDEVEEVEPASQNWRVKEQRREVCEVLSLVMVRPIVKDLKSEEWDVLGEHDVRYQ